MRRKTPEHHCKHVLLKLAALLLYIGGGGRIHGISRPWGRTVDICKFIGVCIHWIFEYV